MGVASMGVCVVLMGCGFYWVWSLWDVASVGCDFLSLLIRICTAI